MHYAGRVAVFFVVIKLFNIKIYCVSLLFFSVLYIYKYFSNYMIVIVINFQVKTFYISGKKEEIRKGLRMEANNFSSVYVCRV